MILIYKYHKLYYIKGDLDRNRKLSSIYAIYF